MKKFLFIVVVLAALGGAWFALGKKALHVVSVTQLTRGAAVDAIYATGTVEPSVMMPIAARASGRLMELNVDEGQSVAKDEILARLENNDLQKSLDGLKARETFAAAEYKRQSGLLKKGFATRQTVDQAQAEMDSARAAVAAAEAQIGYTQLQAPAEGRVIRRDGEIGQLISAGEPVFWLSCCSPLRISAEVDEEDIPYVKEGLKTLLRSDAFPGKTFGGRVTAITPKGDATARSFRVRISLDDADTPLMIGMTVEANIVTQERQDALLVPTRALRDDALWLVRDGKLLRQAVTVGVKGIDKAEITEGVTEQDVIVLDPEDGFEDGAAVRVKAAP